MNKMNKMKKIVITGGLGYIGTEVCKLYSGESRHNNITIIDSRFLSSSVEQLRNWGMNFIQSSILDEEILEKELKDADVVIHLAGITDVAYTKIESNTEKDEQIKKIGIFGTRNIIKYSGVKTKIIFPSTHVVYEGLNETCFDISESHPVSPVLTYSTGKAQSEKDLIDSGKSYIILRLGSVYGLSQDSMRIGIMPNLFSKIASQDGKIKLFSGGVQFKSLVSVFDVSRCIKFMEKSEIENEIFHLSNEQMSIKQVADICKEFNPNISILETDDAIPNLGYTLSNNKLLTTGFEFRYNLRDGINEMINKWSKKIIKKDLEFIIKGDREFIDHRGKISNYELPESINHIGLIESKAGTIRANHYHPIQEQKCLLVKGKYISVIKDLLDSDSVIETRLIQEGDIAVIKPNVAHTMVFLEDSIFLNLVRGEREHNNYGITHTIPYNLVDEKFKNQLINGYKKDCRCCGNTHLKKVISLGKSPLANNLLNSSGETYETFPLEVDYCPNCHNCQLNYVVPSSQMFDDYLYVSSTSKSFREHFEKAATDYIKKYALNSTSLVVDIGSNDGIALKPFKERGIRVIGVEPASNISKIANENGITTLNEYFTDKTFKDEKIADLVTASNMFAHTDDLKGVTKNVFRILKDSGTFIVEVQYLLDTIKDLTFDNIYHEHVNYWSVTSINNFFNNLELRVVDVEHIDTHGGSIRVFVQKSGEVSENVVNFLKNEEDFGLKNYQTYIDFSHRVLNTKYNLLKKLRQLKQSGKTIIGFGSPAKATTALNYYGVDFDDIKFIVEDNPLKHNKFMPGTGIPIVTKSEIKNKDYLVIILAWNFAEYIKENNKDLIESGVEFISIKDLV
jgi:nucleoside-diphosphate-sugar epimerase/SAM-dependent methyltransferase/dTDP-4-dehydrorhamnose 3,5-epimerase-like enzyme